MSTFIMFGKYSQEAIKGIGPKRTDQAVKIIRDLGGTVDAMYVTIGDKDLILIVNLPGVQEILKASVALNRATGISFTTLAAVKVEEFDQMMGGK